MPIAKSLQQALNQMVAQGHARFGPVAPRKPYQQDDGEGGLGSPEPPFKSHPLLNNMPIGAASDLTAIVSENSQSTDAAKERADDLCLELQQQPVLRQALQQKYSNTNTPKPSPL